MSARHVISFPIEGQRFNFRAAGIIIVDGHVLVCREDDDDYTMLPGGRIELGEDSRFSLTREMEEELAMPAEVGRMIATSESFYRRDDEDFHELSFFTPLTCRDRPPMASRPGYSGPMRGISCPSIGCPWQMRPWRISTSSRAGCPISCAHCQEGTSISSMTSGAGNEQT